MSELPGISRCLGWFSWIWMFPKIVGFPPNHPILIGFSMIFTIHFWVFSPIFGNTHIYGYWKIAHDSRITYLAGESLVFAANQSETERNSSLPLEWGEFIINKKNTRRFRFVTTFFFFMVSVRVFLLVFLGKGAGVFFLLSVSFFLKHVFSKKMAMAIIYIYVYIYMYTLLKPSPRFFLLRSRFCCPISFSEAGKGGACASIRGHGPKEGLSKDSTVKKRQDFTKATHLLSNLEP